MVPKACRQMAMAVVDIFPLFYTELSSIADIVIPPDGRINVDPAAKAAWWPYLHTHRRCPHPHAKRVLHTPLPLFQPKERKKVSREAMKEFHARQEEMQNRRLRHLKPPEVEHVQPLRTPYKSQTRKTTPKARP